MLSEYLDTVILPPYHYNTLYNNFITKNNGGSSFFFTRILDRFYQFAF